VGEQEEGNVRNRIERAHFVNSVIPAPCGAVVLWFGRSETGECFAHVTPCLAIVHLSEHVTVDNGNWRVTKGNEVLGGVFVPLTYSAGNGWYEADEDGDGWIVTPQTGLWEIVLRLEQQSNTAVEKALPVILETLRRVGIIPS
jgi:hypothetical protein